MCRQTAIVATQKDGFKTCPGSARVSGEQKKLPKTLACKGNYPKCPAKEIAQTAFQKELPKLPAAKNSCSKATPQFHPLLPP
jgi:hypothetical protein